MKKTVTRLMAGAALLALAPFALAGCSGGGGSDDAGSASEEPKVGFSAAVLDNPFTAGLVDSVVNGANGSGLNMLPATNADGDPAKQITDIQTLLSQGIEGLVLIPRDSDAIVPGVENANQAGVPVVTVDTAANGGDVYMQVRADNVQMGEAVCEQIGELVGGTGTVLELHGTLSTTSGYDRNKGFNDCMQEKYPDVEIIAKDAGWESEKSADAAQTVLSTTKVDAVFMASDSVMLASVGTVMKNLGQWNKVGEDGHIYTVTIDGSGESLQAIRDGYVDAVVSQPVDKYGEYAIQYLKDAIAGKEYQVGPTDHDSEIVDYEGTLADMLPSPTITKENVDDDSLWGNAS